MRQAIVTCWTLAILIGLMGCAEKQKEAVEQDTLAFSSQRVDESGLLVKEFDLNQDQKPDVFKYFRKADQPAEGEPDKVLVKRELDLNGDGRIDVITIYTDEGDVETESFDLDFDGRIDLVDYYAKDQIVKKAIDFAFDEKPDIFKFYMRGELVRIEQDKTGNGRIDHWEYYQNGAIDRIGDDIDGDGQVDTWRTADQNTAQDQAEGDDQGAAMPKAPDPGQEPANPPDAAAAPAESPAAPDTELPPDPEEPAGE